MRILWIYSLNNFHIYHTEVLAVITMLYTASLALIYQTPGSLYLLTTFYNYKSRFLLSLEFQ